MEKHEIWYGEDQIKFHLKRKDVKNINLSIKPNLLIEVSANHEVPIKDIHSFVKRKARWILKNKGYFIKVFTELRSEKEYINGESFRYLGRQYRLKVIKNKREEVKNKKGFFYIYVEDKNDYKRKKDLLDNWYKEKSSKVFEESLQKMYSVIKKYGIKKPKIGIRKNMKTRWGSCIEKKNIILLNKDLIEAPKFCIDYVILHELIHFKHKNHDKKFYRLQESLMPDWKKRKEILDNEVVKDL